MQGAHYESTVYMYVKVTSGISLVSLLRKIICKIETIEQYDYEGCFARFFEQKQRCPIE